MSIPLPPDPAKLVIGLFTGDTSLGAHVAGDLSRSFGGIDTVSPWIPFDNTDYYREEMGGPLYRRMLSFGTLVKQEDLAGIKTETNRLEEERAFKGNRQVNIDPGYLLKERFVLGTGKNYAHRIYVGKGIYADLTLTYAKGEFKALPWTYPDYMDERVLLYLSHVRKKYLWDLNSDSEVSGTHRMAVPGDP